VASITLARPGSPGEIQVKLRTPLRNPVMGVTVNGRPATLAGLHKDTVVIATGNEQQFEIVGRLGA
jgi:hypothetical protein